MDLQELLQRLDELDVRLQADGDRLLCNAPRGAMTAALTAAIQQHKQELLALKRDAVAAPHAAGDLDPIPRLPIAETYPLSVGQERLWYLEHTDSLGAAYNIPGSWWLRGPLDVDALGASLQDFVDRHIILRATFRSVQGVPRIRLLDELAATPEYHDLADAPDGEVERRLHDVLETESARPFDIGRGPLIRFLLLRAASDEHVLALIAHHCVWDGWSFDIFLDELKAHYERRTASGPGALPELPCTFLDFASWQRQHLESAAGERALRYWREQLAGELPAVELPTDRPRPPRMTYEGGRVKFRVDPQVGEALNALARAEGCTPFMVFLAAFKVFLARYTGETDLIIGAPVQGRLRPEVERLVGFFVNNLVLRTRIDPEASFRDHLVRVRDVCLGAYAHQQVPFERLVAELVETREPSRTPLFQTSFSYQHTANRPRQMGQLRIESARQNHRAINTDLVPWVRQAGAEIDGGFDYRADLFDRPTVERMVEHWLVLLDDAVSHPGKSLHDLRLMSDGERTLLVQGWNQTSRKIDRRALLWTPFAAHAERRPDAPAVVFGDDTITYEELDRASDALAAHLARKAVGPGALVGVFLERSPLMLVALLGILKVGAAYVPLDPEYPPQRLAIMLQDSVATAVVTTGKLASELPAQQALLVRLDVDVEADGEHPRHLDESSPDASSLAYTIFTSGSTGRPKGVEVTHGAAVNLLASMAEEPGLDARDRLLAVTTLSFDISLLELLGPLSVGGTVLLASDREARSAPDLMAMLERQRPTIMQATPATWQMLLDAGWKGDPELKVLSGGEALSPSLAQFLVRRCGEVWNMYGPTETTVWSTCKRIDNPDDVTIGRPIVNTRVYVLDGHLSPTPIGVPGDLYIGGAGVARGYVGRPDLTAQRFLDDPFHRGGRMYKTGDRARLRGNGEILFLGRDDDQVKLRGHRIELGEIEAALVEQEHVRQAAAAVCEDGTGDKRLVAYILSDKNALLTNSDLRRFLRQRLPPYMVPNLFVELAEAPLTDNGKLDRRSLPDPFGWSKPAEHEYVPPRTSAERAVAAIWEQMLSVDRVGLSDNFFDLGGHSLLSTQMVYRVESETGIRINVRAILMETLGELLERTRLEQARNPTSSVAAKAPGA